MSKRVEEPRAAAAASPLAGEPLWVQRIHVFWFGQQDVRDDDYRHLMGRWYRGGPDFDATVRRQFEPLLRQVTAEIEGLVEHVDRETSPRARLALVILLDQTTRNMYRGEARMFAFDEMARAVVYRALDAGAYAELTHVERLFMCVALEHSELLDDVQRSAEMMAALADTCPAAQRQRFVSMCRYNRQHLDIIAAFGRYPHRNALLGRATSDDEAHFLATKNYRFMRSVYKVDR